MYKYYKEEEREEHLLFAEEIYTIVQNRIPELKANSIHKLIKDYAKEYSIEVEKLYYNTKNGLKRVYPVKIGIEAVTYYLSKRTVV